ncbi:MAG TPA: class I SAM-dependent methyltransferase [Candidatus Acidoferrum sp.]|nr:class I SAM-dependent methyltransferase [Candidatus Acidoferrum sp.]
MESRATVQHVNQFWNTEACGTHFVRSFSDERDFYEKFRDYRYRTEWHIPLLVPFAEAKDKTVLEIGTGNGADGAMFALNGGIYTGVDLTDAALAATEKHFNVLNLKGTFLRQNAEELTLPDSTFDFVYSHGVLHHTPHPARAIDEVWRVLKPGGRAIIMLYHKRSFNYVVRIMLYMRARLLLKILSRAGRWQKDRERLRNEEITGVRGNQDRRIWEIHYQNFLREGWSYLSAGRFVHHCTDGPECPVAFAYNRREARDLFAKFKGVRTEVAHFPLRRYSRWIPFAVERFLAPRLGWYLFIFATK